MASWLIGEMRPGSAGLRQENLSIILNYEFLVQTDDKTTTREQVLYQTTGLPTCGLLYGPLNATCVSLDAVRDKDSVYQWVVRAVFQTAEETQRLDPSNPSADPIFWLPVFRCTGFITKQKALFEDKTPATETNQWGAAGPAYIRNSAGQPFDDPAVELLTLSKISFTQYEDGNLSLRTLMDRNNCVNQELFDAGSGWGDFAKRTLLINVIGARRGYYTGVYCWKVDYEMTYDPDTWDYKPLDVGTSYLDSGTLKAYYDETNTVRINGKLDGSGGKKTGNDYEILSFRIKREVDFATFIRTDV